MLRASDGMKVIVDHALQLQKLRQNHAPLVDSLFQLPVHFVGHLVFALTPFHLRMQGWSPLIMAVAHTQRR
jgi:hypothetical protein